MSVQSTIESIRQTYPNAYTSWSSDDDRQLEDQFKQGVPQDQLAQMFGRQPSAIESRLMRLKLIEQRFPPKTIEKTESVANETIDYDPRVLIVVSVFCDKYKRVFDEPHWSVQKLLRDMSRPSHCQPLNVRLLREFIGVLEFLKSKNVDVRVDSDQLNGYVEFAIDHFKSQNMRVFPPKLKNGELFQRYVRRPMPAPSDLPPIDYRRVLPAHCFDENGELKILGITS